MKLLPQVSPGADNLIRDEVWSDRSIQELTDVALISDPGDGPEYVSI